MVFSIAEVCVVYMDMHDNIVAIATSNGYSGVGVIRISGRNLLRLAKQITNKSVFKPRYALYCDFITHDGSVLDSGLILYFPAPYSFTGEDVLELQGHGSPIVLQMLLKRCIELGCRMAVAGEFSKRAYLNNKIDLVQAESIADLIHAESEASAKSAIRSLQGKFSNYINEINQQLINLRMFVEASLDFPEEDIEFIANAKIRDKLGILQQEMYNLMTSTKQGVVLNNGANIVIVGRPNVGKSSLLNALANEDIAIVTDVAGTTRDVRKEKIIIDGVALNIIDTAGIRDTHDVVEKIGIARAYDALSSADLCLVLMDNSIGITPDDKDILTKLPTDLPLLYVHNKIDLTNILPHIEVEDSITHIYLSAKNNLGIEALREKILQLIGFNSSIASDVFLARTRHLVAVNQAIEHINIAFSNWHNLELLAEELRYAHMSLSSITGEFSADDLLGEIFSRFCIGK